MNTKQCPRCDGENVAESEISMEWKCDDCDFIWGHAKDVGHYYYPNWHTPIGKMVKIPDGCLFVGMTWRTERAEA
jgi:transposase-like protein